LYCEQTGPDGGPVHNRVSAWRARRAQQAGTVVQEEAVSAPVSLARASLEQRLTELPIRLSEVQDFLSRLVAEVRAAGDVEAAGAEVEDAHRDALAKVNEAERRAVAAQRATRSAEQRAAVAAREREEADAAAEEALANGARMREELEAELNSVRAEAATLVAAAREELAAAAASHALALAERDTLVERIQEETKAAQLDAASARVAQEAANETAIGERQATARAREELDVTRRELNETRQRLQAELNAERRERQNAIGQTTELRVELATLQTAAAAAEQAARHDREMAAELGREVHQLRRDAWAEREAARAEYADQLATWQRQADERVAAVTQALEMAREAAQLYRTQLAAAGRDTPSHHSPGADPHPPAG